MFVAHVLSMCRTSAISVFPLIFICEHSNSIAGEYNKTVATRRVDFTIIITFLVKHLSQQKMRIIWCEAVAVNCSEKARLLSSEFFLFQAAF